jgi:hypothetical protein
MSASIKELTNGNAELKKKCERLDKELVDSKERFKLFENNTK